MIKKADTVEEMAAQMKLPKKILKETLETYNRYAKEGKDPLFGKTQFTQTIDRPPYYFGKEKLGVHFCCGGIKLNKNAEVVTTSGGIIPGLYVCGEASGGPHGHDRMGGVGAHVRVCFRTNCGKRGSRFREELRQSRINKNDSDWMG